MKTWFVVMTLLGDPPVILHPDRPLTRGECDAAVLPYVNEFQRTSDKQWDVCPLASQACMFQCVDTTIW